MADAMEGRLHKNQNEKRKKRLPSEKREENVQRGTHIPRRAFRAAGDGENDTEATLHVLANLALWFIAEVGGEGVWAGGTVPATK